MVALRGIGGAGFKINVVLFRGRIGGKFIDLPYVVVESIFSLDSYLRCQPQTPDGR